MLLQVDYAALCGWNNGLHPDSSAVLTDNTSMIMKGLEYIKDLGYYTSAFVTSDNVPILQRALNTRMVLRHTLTQHEKRGFKMAYFLPESFVAKSTKPPKKGEIAYFFCSTGIPSGARLVYSPIVDTQPIKILKESQLGKPLNEYQGYDHYTLSTETASPDFSDRSPMLLMQDEVVAEAHSFSGSYVITTKNTTIHSQCLLDPFEILPYLP